MTPVNAISAINAPRVGDSSIGGSPVKKSEFDSSAFMQMLLAQLTHQNPMEPMNDSEMMGQMTQLNSLQQLQGIQTFLQEMVQVNQTGYAASLIGKQVSGQQAGKTITGKVDSVTINNGALEIHVGNTTFNLDQLTEIKDAPASTPEVKPADAPVTPPAVPPTTTTFHAI